MIWGIIMICITTTVTAAAVIDEYNNNLDMTLSLEPPPPRPHPHAGARDANGNWGYIANVTHLRDWMINHYCDPIDNNKHHNHHSSKKSNTNLINCQLPYANEYEMLHICDDVPSDFETSDTYEVLTNRIQIHDNTNNNPMNHHNIKILCSVYTYEKNHESIRGIAETWGWKCDGFFAASTITTKLFNNTNHNNFDNTKNYKTPPVEMIDLTHEGIEDYTNMWQKTRSLLCYMYDNYLNDYDYFYIAGDDTHIIVENLKYFLYQHTRHINELFTGLMIYLYERNITKIDGGSGYILSRAVLKRFVEEAIPICEIHTISSAEDWLITECLLSIGIGIYDSSDNGLLRFHKYNPNSVTSDNWFIQTIFYYRHKYNLYHKNEWKGNITTISNNLGIDIVSNSSIAFHYIKGPIEMKRHHFLLYNNYHINNAKTSFCPSITKLGQLLLKRNSNNSITNTNN